VFRRWTSPEAVFQILKEVTRGQPCDITGIECYQMIEAAGGIQWPYPDHSNERERARTSGNEGERAGNDPASSSSVSRAGILTQRRLFEDGRFFHRNGRARFRFDPPTRAPELPDTEYPFFLLTGRGTSAQWHTQSRTAKSAVLRKLYPDQIYVEINPDDAKRLGIETAELVEVSSRRGRLEAVAFVTGTVASGQVFIPMHYIATNELTFPAFDPWSRQPAYKSAAVKIVKR
jgi:ferredoxin-nitrate reductase